MHPVSHEALLLRWFHEEKDTITPLEALRHIGDMRLASTVHRLRKKGWLIETHETDAENKFGMRVRYSTYKFKGKATDAGW